VAIIDFFDRGWRMNPHASAYIMDDDSWTYERAGTLSCRLAAALRSAGLPADAKVAVLAPNSPLAMISILGIWRAGYTWVPLNAANPVADNRNLVARFDCCAVLFDSQYSRAVDEIRDSAHAVRLEVSMDDLADWTAPHPDVPPQVPYHPDDIVAIMPTGGTTGPAKGVMITHRSISVAFAHMMMLLHYRAGEPIVNLAAAPITHTAGLLSMPATARGGTVVILRKPEPRRVLAAISRYRVTDLFLPPTMIYRLLGTDGARAADVSSLRYFIYGAAPMSLDKLRSAIDVFGPVMTGAYGQVEAFAAIAYLRPEEHLVNGVTAPDTRLSSCGRPYPLIDVRILDENSVAVPAGTAGEICVRGDLVMKGYYHDQEQTETTIVDGWLHTGDIGHLDGEGYLHITDRRKDIIISGGFNLYPSEIEQVIWSHPAVMDCAVIGTPDDDWGEAVAAVVELNPGMAVSAEELRKLCHDRLGGIRTPKRIEIVQALPRSASGKVLKREVRRPYWSGLDRAI
jgi:acyl-CoA synthetase (AMP-forming)/AMP-acid ligase II